MFLTLDGYEMPVREQAIICDLCGSINDCEPVQLPGDQEATFMCEPCRHCSVRAGVHYNYLNPYED